MSTSYPLALPPSVPADRDVSEWGKIAPLVPNLGSWRYNARRPQRNLIIAAVFISAAAHATIFFGFGHTRKKTTAHVAEPIAFLRLAIPELKELEEPEVVPTEDQNQPTDLATLVPMQADLPQLARPSDFVQAINFTSLLEKPDFSNVSIAVIPENFRGGRKLAESIGKVFSLADLDRIPEAVLQSAPVYPFLLRRGGIEGRVQVEFIVDADGRVCDATIVASTHQGFDEAAVIAVTKWKFRPGMKAGRKVNTRMSVPVLFTLAESS